MLEQVTNPEEAMAALGHTSPTTPDGDVLTSTPVDTSTDIVEPIEPVVEPVAPVKPAEQIDETTRRSWQATADQAMAALEKEKADRLKDQELFRQQNLVLVQQNQQVLNAFENFKQTLAPTPTVEPEVMLVDDDGYLDKEKLKAYITKETRANEASVVQKVTETLKKQKEQENLQGQIAELVKDHPEFKDALGNADMAKIERAYAEKTSNMTLSQVLFGDQVSIDQTVQAIANNASKPTSAVTTQETQTQPKPMPEQIQAMIDMGYDPGLLDLPPDF